MIISGSRKLTWCLPLLLACGGDDDKKTQDPEPLLCGNGVLDAGETCDPVASCPTTCTLRECQRAHYSGGADTCDAECSYTPITTCVSNDDCCAPGCTLEVDSDCTGIRLDFTYQGDYSIVDLGAPPGVPARLGGVLVNPDDSSKLWIGGYANDAAGGLYEIGITRDGNNRITGFSGSATLLRAAPYNDGGIVIGPDGLLFLARWPVNELQMVALGVGDKVIDLDPLGVAYSSASLLFVPTGYPGASMSQVKVVAWPDGQWYTMALTADGAGYYDLGSAVLEVTLPGGPEGVVAVPLGSTLFPNPSILVSNYTEGTVVTYELDTGGDPILSTRKYFIIGLDGAEGAAIDPLAGDFLFTTFGGGDRVVVVHGFKPVIP